MRGAWTFLVAAALLGMFSSPLLAQEEAASESKPANPVIPAETDSEDLDVVAEIPEFHLTQVQLDAEVATDRVNLVVTVEVMINRGANKWHRVPLRLGGLHIFRREYSGPGEEAADVSAKGSDEGLVWRFRGLGKHQLKLHAWVPLKHTVSGGQFQLSLPTMPAQFEARLNARIPDPGAIVRSAKNLTVLELTRTRKETIVDASVVGNLLVFSWQMPSAGGETVSLVQSWMHLKPSAEHLSLVVEQKIELQQTTTDSLMISLPPDFRLVQLSGKHIRSHEILPDRPNWVRVQFTNDNLGQLTLNWGFERELSPGGRTIQLEGLHVEGAVREEGLIRIDEFENLRMVPRMMESQLVHLIGVNQVRDWGTGVPLAAYEFLRQPFRLAFDLQPSVPYFSVEPVDQLRFLKDAIELTVTCRVRFERGAITELKLLWPGWMLENWRVVSVEADTNRTGPMAYDATSQPGTIRLWWPNPLGREAGDAVFTTVFRKPFMESPSSKIELTLPFPQASETEPTILRLDSADELAVKLSTEDGALLPRLPSSSELPELAIVQSRGNDSEIRSYRIENPSEPILAKVDVHEREVRVLTQVEIRDVTSNKLRVDQVIQLDVKYGRLRQLELVIPPELMKHIPNWAVVQGIEVSMQGQKLPVQPGSSSNILVVDLGSEHIGTFDVNVAYSFPVPEDQAIRDVDLPIVSVRNQPFKRAECLIDAVDSVQVRSEKTDWEALQTSPSHARWINPVREGSVSLIPLTVGRKLADSSQQYVVDKVQVRTIFSADGSAESWAEFELESPQTRLVLDFPPGTEFKENAFQVGGKTLPKSAISRRTDQFDEVTIALPPQTSSHPRVTVRYRTPMPTAFGLANLITLPLPRFKGSVWVDETIWEMQLPQGHHLFTYPNLVPQFQWTRHYLMWWREPTPTYLREREDNASANIPAEFRFSPGSFYAFRGFGPIQLVTFHSMNRSLILLIGAGFALLLGFLFWKIPATRNVFSLVVISFLFAAASLWYLEPMLLLLQPAIFGVILALLATVIDSSSQRRQSDRSHFRRDRAPLAEPVEDSSLRSMSTRIYRPVPAGKSDRVDG